MERLTRSPSAAPARFALAVAALVAAAGARGEDAGAPQPRVAAIELRLPSGEDVAAATGLVAIAAGDRLSPRALERTVQRLYQGGRFRNVVVRAVPAPAPERAAAGEGPWVRLVVEALPLRTIAEVRLRGGAPGLEPEALRAAAGLEPGASFEDSDLDAAEGKVRTLLARRGFRAARVAASSRGDRQVQVELAVAAGEPVRVSELRLTGDPGALGPTLLATLATRPGELLDEDALAADVKKVRAELYRAGHRRARVSQPVVRVDGVAAAVEIPVEAGPRVSFVFRGNAEVPSVVLERELGLEEGLPVDPPAIGAAADRLAASYRARGYAGVRVEARELRRGRQLVVIFHVEEGPRYRLADVHVEGLAFHDAAWIRERLAAFLDAEVPEPASLDADDGRELAASVPGVPTPRTPPPALRPHETLEDGAWDRAAERLVDEWRGEGFLEAVYLGASVALDDATRTAETTLRFREGPRTFVDAIAFEGNTVVKLPELARESRLSPGEPLVFERVEATRAAILRIYLNRGYLYARVDAREQVDRERRLAVVRYVVEEGPQVRVGRVLVSGNRRTRESVVRRTLTVGEGDVYDPDAVSRSQGALLRLGVFRSVGLRVQDPEVPQPTKDLSVELSERPWGILSQGVGFSIADGPRAFLEWTQPNLLGRALELTARGKVNYPLDQFRPDLIGKSPADRIEGRTELGLRAPGVPFVRLPAGARGDLIGEILHRPAYDLQRASGVTGVDVGLTSRVSFSLQYELEVDRIHKSGVAQTQADLANLRFDEGVTTLHALRPSLTVDYRDNSTHPQRGWFATAAIEYAHSLGASGERIVFGALPGSDNPMNLVKLSGTASTYLPVGVTVFALSLRGGRIFQLDSTSRTIIPRRFFMGGATTMRGYFEEEMIPEDQRSQLVSEAQQCAQNYTAPTCTESGRRILGGLMPISTGGDVFALGKAELRLPLRGALEGALFVDVGNLWESPSQVRLQDLRASVGFGIRFVTPIGPAALDVGFNVTPDYRLNEPIVEPHFTIGLF